MKHSHEIAAIITIALMLPCGPVVLILGIYCFIQYLRSKNDKRKRTREHSRGGTDCTK